MSEEREYKNLNLNRDCIEPLTREFCAQNGLELRFLVQSPVRQDLGFVLVKLVLRMGHLMFTSSKMRALQPFSGIQVKTMTLVMR